MKIGLVGLGKMGAQIAERLIKGNHQVVAMDVNPLATSNVRLLGAEVAETKQEMLGLLPETAVVWLMIPSSLVQAELESWLSIMPAGSVLIDGGNSDFRQTQARAKLAVENQVSLIDVGTSGGVLGLQNGFSMMVGGDEAAFKIIEPVIKSLAQADGYKHFGPSGAGHFVKMVHNGIEYGVMEAYAEGYRLLHDGPYNGLDLAAIASVWQHGSIISSNLNELSGQALADSPELDGIDGYVAESGEARWMLEFAKELNLSMPVIQAAFDVRVASQAGAINFGTKLLAAMRNRFGGHNINR